MSIDRPDLSTWFPTWLTRSKTFPQTQLVSMVSHAGLDEVIHTELTGQVSLVIAPAGYGKSTFLCNWRQALIQRDYRVAWLNLDDDDNDPGLLTAYLLLAFHEAGFQREIAEFFPNGPDPALTPKKVVTTLGTLIEGVDAPIVLMLDSFEALSSATANNVISPLIEYQPRNLHIIIAGRSILPIAFSSLRVKGLLNELTAQDLKFSRSEIQALFGPQLDSDLLDLVEQRTEGWPVALQILNSRISETSERSSIANLVQSDEPNTSEYLSEQFFSGLNSRHYEFLQDTAMLDLISLNAADHIRQSSDSLQLMSEMRHLEAFIVPLGEEGDTYRLHPLLRDFLRADGPLKDPERWRMNNLRAGEWFAQNGNILRSMRFCIDVDAVEQAGQVLEQADGLRIWFREGVLRVRTALNLLPEEIINSRPRLKILSVLMDYKEGHIKNARQNFYNARRELGSCLKDLDLADDVALAALTFAAYEGTPFALVATETQLFQDDILEPKRAEKWAAAGSMVCLCQIHEGNWQEAEDSANMTLMQLSERSIPSYGEVYIYLHLGLVALKRGEVNEAEERYLSVRGLSHQHYVHDRHLKLVSDVMYAELMYLRGNSLEAACTLGNIEQRLKDGEAWYEVYAGGYFLAAASAYENNGLDDALQVLNNALIYIQKAALVNLERFIILTKCFFLIQSGEYIASTELIEKHGFELGQYTDASMKELPVRQRYLAIDVLCRLLLNSNETEYALEFLTRAVQTGMAKDHVLDTETIRPLLVVALYRQSRYKDAFLQLSKSLQFSRETGVVANLIEKAGLLGDILIRYCASKENKETQFAEKLIQLLRVRSGNTDAEQTQPDMLSDREQDVLKELAKAIPDKTIARNLSISTNTVRFHLKNIFRKLKAENRLMAIRQAQKLHLLED